MSDYSLDSIDAKLGEMLTNSSHMFDLSMNCLLGDTNLDTVKENLYSTDKTINELHRDVRRELIVHSAVNSRNLDVPLLLAYMTMSKDIERIGDYCKNIFEIAETGNSFAKEAEELDYFISLRCAPLLVGLVIITLPLILCFLAHSRSSYFIVISLPWEKNMIDGPDPAKNPDKAPASSPDSNKYFISLKFSNLIS